jgi:hypothetical protein
MGEAKRRKAILGDRYGKPKIPLCNPADYVAFGEKYLPSDIIQDALSFSWNVQFEPVPEEHTAWGIRGLDELLWNPISATWLLSAARSDFYQSLLTGYDKGEVFTILAKSLGLVVMKLFPELDDDD